MTEREIRLCIAGTVSEAIHQLNQLASNGTVANMQKRIEAAQDELRRAENYLNALHDLEFKRGVELIERNKA